MLKINLAISKDIFTIQYPNPINTIKVTIPIFIFCDSGGIRTPNQQSRNLPFYPVELRSHIYSGEGGTRTHDFYSASVAL